jgi:hypothetical protein
MTTLMTEVTARTRVTRLGAEGMDPALPRAASHLCERGPFTPRWRG